MDELVRPHGFARMLFFSDAVFAIAITLLVLDVRLPPGAKLFELRAVWPQIMGFAISFFVVGRFWLAHHSLFEGVRGYDRRLLVANLVFLAAVVFLPFPTTVVAQLEPTPASVGFYGLSLTAVGVLMLLLTWIARRPALREPGETLGGTLHRLAHTGAATLIFILTAAAAQVWPKLALLTLLLLFPVGPLADRLGRRLEAKLDAAENSRRPGGNEAENPDPGAASSGA